VDAAIIVDSTTSFFKEPMYYALAHFAKYITTGSVRIQLDSTATGTNAAMEAGAFLRPDGLVVIVVLNRGDKLSSSTEYCIEVVAGAGAGAGGAGATAGAANAGVGAGAGVGATAGAANARWINMKVPPHSMQTILVSP
jgi:hypothetical protein